MPEPGALFDVEAGSHVESWVYVIGVPDSPIVKIGFSTDPQQRLRGLQTASPEKLALRWRTPGDQQLEGRIQEHFKPLRKSGEWFDFGDLDPVAAIRDFLGHPEEDPSADDDSPEPAAPIRAADQRRPAEDDPDYGDERYWQDTCGCWMPTPAERIALGWAPGGPLYLIAGRPHPGQSPCFGRH